MEFFRDARFDFMKYRKFWISVSLVLLAVGIFAMFVHGRLNLGIEFAGGTQVTLKFRDEPVIDELRAIIGSAGVGEAQIQRFGEEGAHEVLVKAPNLPGREEGSRDEIVSALDARYNPEARGLFDLNQRGRDALAELLLDLDPDRLRAQDDASARAHYEGVAEALMEVRREKGLLRSWDELAGAAGLSPQGLAALKERAHLGGFAVLGVENIGPQIGAELRRKGVLAVLFSLIGMLVYIWFRFELRFGIGALMAAAHDVIVTLGLFALAGYEFNLTTIAAFLTLIGYSVNDTVVIFDRVRENMRAKRSMPLVDLMNVSINQTLSRTILTGGATLLAVGALFVLGGDVLRGFSFILTVGVVVGTYSSIYIASPFALLWEHLFGAEARARKAAAKAQSGKARAASR